MRDRFINPANSEVYEWGVGHWEEEPTSKTRQITNSANTANTGLIPQQGDLQPIVLKYTGTILERAQLLEMWRWFELCETQTIIFADFAGNEYEVIITDFAPKRQNTIRNPRDFTNAPHHYWTHSISMQVLRVIAGDMVGVG